MKFQKNIENTMANQSYLAFQHSPNKHNYSYVLCCYRRHFHFYIKNVGVHQWVIKNDYGIIIDKVFATDTEAKNYLELRKISIDKGELN